jgi:hypothetical protein
MMRERHASANETPSIAVMMSIRRGLTPIWRRQVRRGKAEERCSEPLERAKDALRVRGSRADEDIEVLGRSRLMMHAERVPADDEVRHALLGQDGQHLDVFG